MRVLAVIAILAHALPRELEAKACGHQVWLRTQLTSVVGEVAIGTHVAAVVVPVLAQACEPQVLRLLQVLYLLHLSHDLEATKIDRDLLVFWFASRTA